jgi:pimeloyl-ACP methyl ester carboxylesterase
MKLPLILLHGALGSSAQLKPLEEALSSDQEVKTFDFEGHGGRPSARPFSMKVFTENLIAFMDSHGIEKANFFGYSMGGYVALSAALEHPYRIGKIFTYGTKFDWTPESSAREVNMLQPDKILEKVPQFSAHLIALHGEENWKTLLSKTGEMMLDLGNGGAFIEAQLRSINIPVSLSIGSKDHMVSIEETSRVADLLPNAKLIILEDWIHPVEKLDKERIRQELNAFFGE